MEEGKYYTKGGDSVIYIIRIISDTVFIADYSLNHNVINLRAEYKSALENNHEFEECDEDFMDRIDKIFINQTF